MPIRALALAVRALAPWAIILGLVLTALRAVLVAAAPPGGRAAPAAAGPAPTRPRTASLALRDEELVLGPPAAGFDTAGFVARHAGALAARVETVGGTPRGAGDILAVVAEDHSVDPRVLLALFELATGVVDGGRAADVDTPLGPAVAASAGPGVRAAASWLAAALNEAYYAAKHDGVRTVARAGAAAWAAPAAASSGHVAVAAALARMAPERPLDTVLAEFAALYAHWFGALPEGATRAAEVPPLLLPWIEGETWHFTGGPHEAWGRGTPLGAVDFAPPTPVGCAVAPEWAVAAAPGLVIASRDGLVLLDLDGDGYAGTGLVLQYLHMAAEGRVAVGRWLAAGDPVGHPSCEGGFATGSHLHLARRLDGEWLPVAGGAAPLALSSWRFEAGGEAYVGRMVHPVEGARDALKRRNGESTAVGSDNGPAARAGLAGRWALARAAAAALPSGAAAQEGSAVAALGAAEPPASEPVASDAASTNDAAGGEAVAVAAPGQGAPAAADASAPSPSGAIMAAAAGGGAAPAGGEPLLVVRLRLGGRSVHDTAFTLALASTDGRVFPLIGHTDADGLGVPLTLPPGTAGAYDLTLRVPGFLPARAIGVPLGAAPTVVDFVAGGLAPLTPGDVSGDGDVDLGDLATWLGQRRRGVPAADLNGDGRSGLGDAWSVLRHLGAGL